MLRVPISARSLCFLLLLLLFGLPALAACRPAQPVPTPGRLTEAPATADPVVDTPDRAARVVVDAEGVYALTAQELLAAGLAPDSEQHPIRLLHRSQWLPVWPDGEGGLKFYAVPSDSRYSLENIYLLVQDQEPQRWAMASELESQQEDQATVTLDAPDPAYNPIPRATPAPTPAPPLDARPPVESAASSYLALLVLEQNQLYNPQVESGDPWLWQSLVAPGSLAYTFELPELAPGAGRMRVRTWASTEAVEDPDHHIVLRVNGQVVVDQAWDGRGRRDFEVDLAAGVLKSGANQIEVQAPGDTGVLADIVFVDRIEVAYPRPLQAENDRLGFVSGGGEQLLQGFSGAVDVLAVDEPLAPVRVPAGDYTQDGGQVRLATEAGQRYWVSGPQGYLTPLGLEPAVDDPDLRASDLEAAYIALGPPDLLEPLEPLLQFHQEQGLTTAAVPLQAVYDQFNGGLPEPQAIHNFLRYAVQNWQPTPAYVLLVGDGSYDPLGYQAPPEANRLPVILVPTVFGGETASDVAYTMIDDDERPDLAIGRIPAQTAEQVATVVAKTLDFERQKSQGPWPQGVLAIADGQDASFQRDAEMFLDLFPAETPSSLYSPAPGSANAGQEVRQRWGADPLVAYFGHGSINMWGKDRLFTTEDVYQLKDVQRLPVVFNLTCLTGLFTHPTMESLAEALLWQPGGAVAVMAPTSLTLPTDQNFLSRPLVEALLQDPDRSLGEALLIARQQVPVDNAGSRDVMQTFLLFGDPALKLY